MIIDYKRKYKEFYMPKNRPSIAGILQFNYHYNIDIYS